MANSNTIGSGSYIRIVCTDDADPKYNRLQLRTDPPTFIELKPGNNILSVSKYPALKYGFKQIDIPWFDENVCPDATNEYNCGDVLYVDLSHFDSTEMTSMEDMFRRMENLEEIIFGDIRIENVISMNSAFEWTAVEKLDLTHIDFSQVIDAEMMTYSEGDRKVILTGCNLSNVKTAEGIFNGVSKLNLDQSVLSDVVIEAMRYDVEGGSEDLKEISMVGCEIRMIRSVLKSVMENRPDFLPRVRVILDKEADNQILTSIAPANSWIPKRRREWYITVCSGRIFSKDNLSKEDELLQVISKSLRENNLIEEIYCSGRAVCPRQSKNIYLGGEVYSTGWQFPAILIKTFFDWEFAMRYAGHSKAYSFVVGNYYAAFSDDPELKFYVPVLHSGFVTIEDALNALVETGLDDLSDCRIIEIQYITPSSIPEVLHHSSEWSPFTDGEFNLPSYGWEDKFKAVLSKREGKHRSYIEQCLTKLANTKFNHGEVCTDVDGNKHLIYPSKIIKVSPYSKNDNVIAAVSLEGNLTLRVDLLLFTKELTGYLPYNESTISISGEKTSDEIHVPNIDLTVVFNSIVKKAEPIFEKWRREEEEREKTSSSVRGDEGEEDDDDVFRPEDDGDDE